MRALRIVLVENPDRQVGYCSFWCDGYRYGIRPSIAGFPNEDVDDEDEEGTAP